MWRTEETAVLSWIRGSSWRDMWVILSPWQPKILPQEQFVNEERTGDVEAWDFLTFYWAHMNSDVTYQTSVPDVFLMLSEIKRSCRSLPPTYQLPKWMKERKLVSSMNFIQWFSHQKTEHSGFNWGDMWMQFINSDDSVNEICSICSCPLSHLLNNIPQN